MPQEGNSPVIEQNISDHIQREMDDMVSILDDRVQNAIVAAVNKIIVPTVAMSVRSKHYASSRA